MGFQQALRAIRHAELLGDKLKLGERFHDGEPVLAKDCVASLKRWSRRDTFGQTLAAAVATRKMQTVNLARPVPVLLLYWTAQPLANGQVTFRNDVYGRDPPLLKALDAPFVFGTRTPA